MELQGEDGSLIMLEEGCRKELGRGPLMASTDPTVSRRQVLIELRKENDTADVEGGFNRVYVEVLGPNPICILRSGELEHKSSLEFLKMGQSSFLRIGDRFSLSVKHIHFFTLKKKEEKGPSEAGNEEEDEENRRIEEAIARRQRRAMERKQKEKLQDENEDFNRGKLEEEQGKGKEGPRLELELEEQDETEIQDLGLLQSLDISHIDPVAEFGFLKEGSEFEQYGRHRVPDARRWDLFLGKDSEKSSEDEDEDEDFREEKKLKGRKGKHKKKRETKDEKEDEDWTGESEEEKTQINKLKGSKKPRALKTRTSSRKDSSSTVFANTGSNKKPLDDDIDENDETLGGFIVDDEVETTEDEDEEEEFQLTDDDSEEEDEDKDGKKGKPSKERKPLCKYGIDCYRKNEKHLEEFRHTQ